MGSATQEQDCADFARVQAHSPSAVGCGGIPLRLEHGGAGVQSHVSPTDARATAPMTGCGGRTHALAAQMGWRSNCGRSDGSGLPSTPRRRQRVAGSTWPRMPRRSAPAVLGWGQGGFHCNRGDIWWQRVAAHARACSGARGGIRQECLGFAGKLPVTQAEVEGFGTKSAHRLPGRRRRFQRPVRIGLNGWRWRGG